MIGDSGSFIGSSTQLKEVAEIPVGSSGLAVLIEEAVSQNGRALRAMHLGVPGIVRGLSQAI
jgi:hypothetical protein